MDESHDAARRLRQFNRFYTRRLGLLGQGHLSSPYSLAEVRVLYEVANRKRPTATEVAIALEMDEGYLSRLLRRLIQQGLVEARPIAGDRRQRALTLTVAGRRSFRALDARATSEVLGLIQELSPAERDECVRAVTSLETLLGAGIMDGTVAIHEAPELTDPVPGDLGWVIQRHGEIYDAEYGWDVNFERVVAGIVGEFATAPSGPLQRCWIARIGGRRAGTVFLVPGDEPDTGRLRLLLVEPWARGRQLGRLLVSTCISAAREAGCQRLVLWTNDVLVAARGIYENEGFTLVSSERHLHFGKPMTGQTWELKL